MCFVQGIWKHYYKEKYLSFTTVANNYFLTITCKLFSHYVKKNQHAEKQQQKKRLNRKKSLSFVKSSEYHVGVFTFEHCGSHFLPSELI